MVVCAPGSIEPQRELTASVYGLSKEEGGRSASFFSVYAPQFFFLDVGLTFAMREGDRTISAGTITTIGDARFGFGVPVRGAT